MELTRLTARYGSAAVLTYSVPVEATPSQFGANVEACDTRTCGTEVNGGGCGGRGADSAATTATAAGQRGENGRKDDDPLRAHGAQPSMTGHRRRAHQALCHRAGPRRAQASMKMVAGCSRHSLSAWIMAAAS